MEIIISLTSELSLKLATTSTSGGEYPTRRMQKGLLLLDEGQELGEEAVGFGVPVLKRGLQTIFPGDIELATSRSGSNWEITALFEMNLEEKIARRGVGSVRFKLLYTAKNFLAALHRRFPILRGLLTTISNGLRWIFRWETLFEDAGVSTMVKMIYTINIGEGRVNVALDTTSLLKDKVTEVVIMNEQGARHFDQYWDSGGVFLQGKEIGSWDEVTAKVASFISASHRLEFSLKQVEGSRLFRGRELISSRLAWAGFGYSLSPNIEKFSYDIAIEKIS